MTLMTRYIHIITLSFITAVTVIVWAAPAAAQTLYTSFVYAPKYEVRAVWLTTFGGLDWPHTHALSPGTREKQQAELRDILDRLQAAGVNTVLFQVRTRAMVLYPSAYETWDPCLTGREGVSPGYDPLLFAVDECHKRGMEIHAWLATIPIGSVKGKGYKDLKSKHPELVTVLNGKGLLNPEKEGTANYIAKICKEITERYDVDGIHLDFIRYPETWNFGDKRRGKGQNAAAAARREQGRAYITAIVRRIHDAVKSVKPWVKMSCAPVGKYSDLTRYSSRGWNAHDAVCQDVHTWLRDGLMDEIFPMMYFRDNQFFPFALDWKENAYGRIVAPGLGIYMLTPKEGNWDIGQVKRQMNVLRAIGLGHAYFRSKFLTDNTKGIYSFVKDCADLYPALVPPMTWYNVKAPDAPKGFNVHYTPEGDLLTWNDRSQGDDYMTYNIYASTSLPVDINDPTNIVRARYRGEGAVLPPSGGQRHYAVTATNRYGMESAPAVVDDDRYYDYDTAAAPLTTDYFPLLPNDGRALTLPDKGYALTADYVTVETLQGTILMTAPYARNVSIARLPEGMYVLKSLGKKGVTHRLGFFTVRRKLEQREN